MNTRTAALAGIAIAAVVALGTLGTWRLATAHGPDLDENGVVTILDILAVAQSFGNLLPHTPTPTPIPPGLARFTFVEDVVVGNHVAQELGAFDPVSCPKALIFLSVALDQPNGSSPGSFDIGISSDEDGIPDTNVGTTTGLSTSVPTTNQIGEWLEYRIPPSWGGNASTSSSVRTVIPGSDWPGPYAMVAVFSNHQIRYHMEVQCNFYEYP